MARESNRLNVKEIEAALKAAKKEDGEGATLYDGGGIMLIIRKGGAGRWLLRMADKSGRRRDLGLGPCRLGALRASEARDLAAEMRKAILAGRNPVVERQALRDGVMTFEKAAERLHAEKVENGDWTNGKHVDQWINTLRQYAFKKIGSMPVGDVSAADVCAVLRPIWASKAETARRVHQRISAVLKWAVANGHRPENLTNAAEASLLGLPKQPARDNHWEAVPWREVPQFLERVRMSKSTLNVRWGLELLLLTAARSGNVFEATWDEFDLHAAIWAIPAEKMKMARPLRVPLATQAVNILRQARSQWPSSKRVFPGCRDPRKPLSNAAFESAMERLGYSEVPHGLRSSFRDWAADNGKDADLAEAALGHVVRNKTVAAYQRSDLLERRKLLMQEWADFATRQMASDIERAAA